MSQRQKLGFGAAAALLFGVFCPVMQLPFVGGMSLSQGTYGYILIAMALLAAVAVGTQRWKVVWVPAITSCLQLNWMLVRYVQMKREMKSEMGELEDNPVAGLAQLAITSVRLDWGVIVLLAASVGLVWVAWSRWWGQRGGEGEVQSGDRLDTSHR